jgi:hypothetical protein
MLTSTVAGDAYTFSQLEAMYREAKFENIRRQDVPAGPHTVVLGNAA